MFLRECTLKLDISFGLPKHEVVKHFYERQFESLSQRKERQVKISPAVLTQPKLETTQTLRIKPKPPTDGKLLLMWTNLET